MAMGAELHSDGPWFRIRARNPNRVARNRKWKMAAWPKRNRKYEKSFRVRKMAPRDQHFSIRLIYPDKRSSDSPSIFHFFYLNHSAIARNVNLVAPRNSGQGFGDFSMEGHLDERGEKFVEFLYFFLFLRKSTTRATSRIVQKILKRSILSGSSLILFKILSLLMKIQWRR